MECPNPGAQAKGTCTNPHLPLAPTWAGTANWGGRAGGASLAKYRAERHLKPCAKVPFVGRCADRPPPPLRTAIPCKHPGADPCCS